MPELPDVRSYSTWMIAIKRIVQGACDEPQAALLWINKAFDNSCPLNDFKDGGKFTNLDVALAMALAAQVTKVSQFHCRRGLYRSADHNAAR